MAGYNYSEQAIAHNIREIRFHTDSRIIAVLRKQDYGTELETLWRILRRNAIDFFAVFSPEEALLLRSLGCTEDILLLTPELSVGRCEELLLHNIVLMLGSDTQASVLKEASSRTKIVPRIHLAIDTGSGQFGFPWNRLDSIKPYTVGMRLEGCCAHLVSSFCPRPSIRRQVNHFHSALATLSAMHISYGITHISSSSSFLSHGDLGCDAIRIGSLLLGFCPAAHSDMYQRAIHPESLMAPLMIQRQDTLPGSSMRYSGYPKTPSAECSTTHPPFPTQYIKESVISRFLLHFSL